MEQQSTNRTAFLKALIVCLILGLFFFNIASAENFPEPVSTNEAGVKLYLCDSEGHLGSSPQSGSREYRTVWYSGSRQWDGYHLTSSDELGNWYYYKLYIASLGRTHFRMEILVDNDVVASKDFWVLNSDYAYRTGYIEGIKPNVSAGVQVKLQITIIDGAGGGVTWGGGVDAYILSYESDFNSILLAQRTNQAPTIDGDMESIWNIADVASISRSDAAETPPDDDDDLSGSIRLLWDNTNLYLFLHRLDDRTRTNSTEAHQNDGIEIYFDANNSKGSSLAYDGVDDLQLRINYDYDNYGDIDIGYGNGTDWHFDPSGIVFERRNISGGWNMEISIPLTALKISAADGKLFGFDIQQNDNDSNKRDHIMRWWGDDNNAYLDASLFGTAKLVDESGLLVYMPDTKANAGATIDIPVMVSNTTGKGVYSVGLTVETDTDVLTPQSASTDESLAEGWGNPTTRISDGQIIIGMSGTTPLSGSGALIYIRYKVKSNANSAATSLLKLSDVLFNEGFPSVDVDDGVFTVIGTTVKGRITYYSNDHNVEDAVVSLTGVGDYTDVTNSSGKYEFSNIPYGNYTNKPGKEEDIEDAISPYDASRVLQYYVGLVKFSPYQRIAADVSGNCGITPYDASLILQNWVGLIPKFPVMPDTTHYWTFVPESFQIDDDNWCAAPDYLKYEPLNSELDDQDFVGIIYGDPSGNWDPSGSLAKGPAGSVTLGLGEINWKQEKTFTIPVTLADASDLAALGLVFNYDSEKIKIVNVSATELSAGCTFAYNDEAGKIKVAFAGAEPINREGVIANITCEVLQSLDNPADLLSLTDAVVNEGSGSFVIQNRVNSSLNSIPVEFSLSQAYPNPFNPQTMIQYQLPQKSNVALKIYNLYGQEVRTLVQGEKEAGSYEVHWNGRDDLGQRVSSGIYIYRIQAGEFMQSRKLTLLK